MRKALIYNDWTVEYPEQNTWGRDNNVVRFHYDGSTYSTWKGNVTVGGTSLGYTTETTDLVINISDLLNTKTYDTAIAVRIDVYISDTLNYGFDTTITHHRGMTLATRLHGSAEYVEIDSVEDDRVIYSAGTNVTISDKNGNVVASGDDAGIYTITEPSDENLALHVVHDGRFGKIWNAKRAKYDVSFYVKCGDIIVRYFDTDGIQRLAHGKVINSTLSANQTEYDNTSSVIRSMPNRHIDGSSEVLQVGFVDIPPEQYLEDMILSDEVWTTYNDGNNNVNVPLVPRTLSVTRDDDTKDIVVDFLILS